MIRKNIDQDDADNPDDDWKFPGWMRAFFRRIEREIHSIVRVVAVVRHGVLQCTLRTLRNPDLAVNSATPY
jgi:hypothetical protein